ncbi:MAG: carbohydrate-binding domain-containing protein [Oscillospiraceae bacterium]|nr:carbohydrate-binding domain-containing protein [Oscillospiraceae bacterium]
MVKKKILRLMGLMLIFAMVLSFVVSANSSGSPVTRGLVTGDVAQRSLDGELPNIADALAILRNLVGLPTDMDSEPFLDGIVIGGGSTGNGESTRPTVCAHRNCNRNAVHCLTHSGTVAPPARCTARSNCNRTPTTCNTCRDNAIAAGTATIRAQYEAMRDAYQPLRDEVETLRDLIEQGGDIAPLLQQVENYRTLYEYFKAKYESFSVPPPPPAPNVLGREFALTAAQLNSARTIVLNGTTATVRRGNASAVPVQNTLTEGVRLRDGPVVDGRRQLEIRESGVFILQGTFAGYVRVRAATGSVTLVLDGVSITATNGPAIFIRRAEFMTIGLPEGRTNTLIDGRTPGRDYYYPRFRNWDNDNDPTEPNATLFAHPTLLFFGRGTLNVQGHQRHGIASRDYIFIQGGNINVNTRDHGNTTVGNAIHGRDGVRISGGIFNLQSANHGIRANNNRGAIGGVFEPPANPSGAWSLTTANNRNLSANGGIVISGGRFSFTTNSDAFRPAIDGPAYRIRRSGMRITGAEFPQMNVRLTSGVEDDDPEH